MADRQFLEQLSRRLADEALMRERRIVHDGDPVLAWTISNVVGHYDARSNVYPRKESNEKRWTTQLQRSSRSASPSRPSATAVATFIPTAICWCFEPCNSALRLPPWPDGPRGA